MNVNSLQRKKPSEMMGEYVAGKNRVNVIPRTVTRGIDRAQPESPAVLRSVRRPAPTATPGMSRAEPEYKGAGAGVNKSPSGNFGGTVLTQEQILANNINDVIRRMNEIMSQPGNLLPASMSPYYNIYMEQYRKNAEAAEANAYARSVASTGGYGSSYATMAGQRAYSDTMEGFTELTPSMVQTKGQAMSELMQQYQMAKQMQTELKAQTKDVNDATYEAYVSAANGGWYTGDNETSLRARLENLKEGNPDIDVDKVLEMLKKEYVAPVKPDVNDATYGAYEDAMAVYSSTGDRSTVKAFLENLAAYNPDIDVDKVMEMFNKINPVYIGPEAPEDISLNEENVDAAYQYISEVIANAESPEMTLSQIENTVRTSLRNLRYSDAEIDAAMEKYKDLEKASAKDKKNENKELFEKALADPGAFDLKEIGYTAEAVAEMTDAEKKHAILDEAGEATKRGEFDQKVYWQLVYNDVTSDIVYINSADAGFNKKRKMSETLDIAVDLENYHDAGYLPETQYNHLTESVIMNQLVSVMGEEVIDGLRVSWSLGENEFLPREEQSKVTKALSELNKMSLSDDQRRLLRKIITGSEG